MKLRGIQVPQACVYGSIESAAHTRLAEDLVRVDGQPPGPCKLLHLTLSAINTDGTNPPVLAARLSNHTVHHHNGRRPQLGGAQLAPTGTVEMPFQLSNIPLLQNRASP